MESQLKRGILPFCILKIIEQEEKYGYDIVKQIQESFPDTDESTIYAILRRLNKDGLTDTQLVSVPNAPSRKYYRLSLLGKQRLDEYSSSWNRIVKSMQKLGINIL